MGALDSDGQPSGLGDEFVIALIDNGDRGSVVQVGLGDERRGWKVKGLGVLRLLSKEVIAICKGEEIPDEVFFLALTQLL